MNKQTNSLINTNLYWTFRIQLSLLYIRLSISLALSIHLRQNKANKLTFSLAPKHASVYRLIVSLSTKIKLESVLCCRSPEPLSHTHFSSIRFICRFFKGQLREERLKNLYFVHIIQNQQIKAFD